MKNISFLLLCLFWASNSLMAQDNVLSKKEVKQGWILLFNGTDLNGWTSVGKTTPPAHGWMVDKGVLTVQKEGNKRGGDIITTEQYSDFELVVDFKLTKGANSGIKYFFTRYAKGGWLGLEYQIIDDENHPDAKLGRNGNRKLATLYDMFPAPKTSPKPVGEWNRARIVSKGTKVEHYLNGKKVLSFDRASKEYKDALSKSKYKESSPSFGEVEKGHILLQDHGDVVSFKNIKIREL
ncbi:3-keto-disaccharide hydrolase [Parabacteroides pacaensis]|uniref:3-keto-disaccharide hydrolase n=1 Tax=Parabacteroides pacaensis TaxID=2086575 RepID=UPI000D0FDFEA|nr:DUF1080 domain-containing protein [Parabacteroides pacaensis]